MEESYPSMDVDDLFGDTEQVTLPQLTAPAAKDLPRRLDELSTSGCCTKLAWSKNGCVAYITPDGLGVNLKVFSNHLSTGRWDLGKDVALDMPRRQEPVSYVHLSWSHLGNDLVVMDAAGRVMIFSCAMALDRMTYHKTELVHPESEFDAVVGMHWLAILPYEQKNHIAWAGSRKGHKWEWNISSHTFHDAHHPIESKASMIYLKRHGELKLRFQQPDSSWHEAAAQPSRLVSTKEIFTHAAFASNNDNDLLLAAYTVTGHLYLYRINVRWNMPAQKPNQPPKQFDKPELRVKQVLFEDKCQPTMVTSDLNGSVETTQSVPAQLTHLDFLPATPEQNDGSVPTIQAIFSSPPNVVSFDQSQPQQNPISLIIKWQVHQEQISILHSSLDKVTSKKKSVSSVPKRTVWGLERPSDIMMHAVVLSFASLWYNMILAFCYSDGTIELRKRSTMEVLTPDFNTDLVTSLPRAGFTFPNLDSSLHFAMSPNHCMVAGMQQDGTIKLHSMEYTHGTLSTDDEDPKHSAAIAALVLQTASSANQYFCNGDIFAVMGNLTDKRIESFISTLFDALQVNIDCGIDDQGSNHLILLGRTPLFVKTLSTIHILGLQGSVTRTLTSKLAWAILNIKYVTQILTTIARMHGQIEKNPLRPEVVPQFIGICRWIMHFMIYMIDGLIELGRELQDIPPNDITREKLEETIHKMNMPALLIILSAFPRMMMKLWAQPITWAQRTALSYVNGQTPTPEIRRLYTPLHMAVSDIPFDWRLFESLISEAQQLVRSSYRRANFTDEQRNQAEREVMLGHIPEVLVPAARRLVTDTLWNENQQNGCLTDKLNMARVMFFDTTWLGLRESNHAREYFETHVVDVCQKMVIRGTGAQTHLAPTIAAAAQNQNRGRSDSLGAQSAASGLARAGMDGEKKKAKRLRKCTRCGAYMEDVMQGLPGYANHHVSFLMGVAKHCVCGNSWMLAEEKKRAT